MMLRRQLRLVGVLAVGSHLFIGNAAKIRALLVDRRKNSHQNAAAYAFQRRRMAALRRVVDGIEIEAISLAGARHSLEHFDERLDGASRAMLEGRSPDYLNVIFNLVVSRQEAIPAFRGGSPSAKIVPLRVYFAHERLLVNLDDEVDIGRLRSECAALRDRLAPLVLHEDESDERRGAHLYFLGPEQLGRNR